MRLARVDGLRPTAPLEHRSALELREHPPTPGLGRLDCVERVEVESIYAGGWVGDQGREILDEAGRLVEAAALRKARDEPEVLDEEPLRVRPTDPGRDREELLR